MRDWYADNQLAAAMIGVSQMLSVCCLGAFAVLLPGTARSSAQTATLRRARRWGLVAMALMMLSSVLGWLLAAIASDAALGAVSVLRTANFVAGGPAHVATLAIFVWLASRTPGFGKPVRILRGTATGR